MWLYLAMPVSAQCSSHWCNWHWWHWSI